MDQEGNSKFRDGFARGDFRMRNQRHRIESVEESVAEVKADVAKLSEDFMSLTKILERMMKRIDGRNPVELDGERTLYDAIQKEKLRKNRGWCTCAISEKK